MEKVSDEQPPKLQPKAEKEAPSGSKRKRGGKRFSCWHEKSLNPSCNEVHPIAGCKPISTDLKKKLLEEYHLQKRRKLNGVKTTESGDARYKVTINDSVSEIELGDSGSHVSTIPRRVLDAKPEAGTTRQRTHFEQTKQLQSAVKSSKKVPSTASMQVRVNFLLVSRAGGLLHLRNFDFWVINEDLDEIILGRPLLYFIRFDLDLHLTKVREEIDNLDVAGRLAASVNVDYYQDDL